MTSLKVSDAVGKALKQFALDTEVHQAVELLKNPKVKILNIVNYHSCECFTKELMQLFEYVKRDQQEQVCQR